MTSLAIGIAAAFGTLPGSSRAQEAPVAISIPAQPLGQALLQLGRQAGLQLFFSQDTVAGYSAPAVSGSLAPDEALRRLLTGTDVRFRRTGRNVSLSRVAADGDSNVSQLSAVRVVGRADEDQQKKDDVYQKNVTNLYVDRKDLERYQTGNPADIFKGMAGVYSMDPRNGSAISPNIRGLSGQGRVPVTVDGTEQSTDIWLGTMYGVGNKSYVDPSLFRSVEVEKGPSLSRGVRSGAGGAVVIRTIEPDDIIAEGNSFGIELKAETSGNTVRPSVDGASWFGKDYRDIPGAVVGMSNNVNVPQPVPQEKEGKDAFNFQDKSLLVTMAGRNDVADVLLSYSYREKGNYFSGKKGADHYENHDPLSSSTDRFFPNLARLYKPGQEVLNTSSKNNTFLLKNNWYLPNDQKIGISFMRTKLNFGETNNAQAYLGLGFSNSTGVQQAGLAAYPRSQVQLDTWKLSYAYKPEGARWIDFEANAWTTQNKSYRHQTGGGLYAVREQDPDFKQWQADYDAASNQHIRDLTNWNLCRTGGAPTYMDITDPFWCDYLPELMSPTPPEAPVKPPAPEKQNPNTDGRYNVIASSSQWTNHKRSGFDFSNLMRFNDKVSLVIAGEGSYERLGETITNLGGDAGTGLVPGGDLFHATTRIFGPRSGTRHEWVGSMNLEWKPTSWLTLTAGTRYNKYWSFDEGLAERRRNRMEGSQIVEERTGVKLTYLELMSDAERATYDQEVDWVQQMRPVWQSLFDEYYTNNSNDPEIERQFLELDKQLGAITQKYAGKIDGVRAIDDVAGTGPTAGYWKREVIVPVVDGKVDSSQSPIARGEIDLANPAVVDNPQGLSGKYATAAAVSGTSTKGTDVYTSPAAGEEWTPPKRQSGHAWSPVFSATVRLTDHATLFGRYAQITRFPSIFEIASTSIGSNGTPFLTQGAKKPERSRNWEIGYAHDLRQFFPRLPLADVRISYYNTDIKDFMDRDLDLNLIQFDRKKSSGLELQSRFDSGRVFGGLGVTRRLTQKVCDRDYAYGLDVYYNRLPECMDGGFPDNVTTSSLQPKISLTADLGTRLLGNKLELGMRAVYHTKAKNKQMDGLLAQYSDFFGAAKTADPYYWNAVMLLDMYAQYQVSKNVAVNLGVTNLTDRYYLDPMAKFPAPGPGRTVTLGVKARF